MKIDKVRHIYHAVPDPMFGTTLYPLNTLRAIHPTAYEQAVKKYEWRKSYLDMTIPKLNCLWNDVLHFTIIHPEQIFRELKSASLVSSNPMCMFYEVPIEAVLQLPCAIYLTPEPVLVDPAYTSNSQAPELVIDPTMVQLPGEFEFLYPRFPNATREYFKYESDRGRRPLAFNGLPHFLLQGSIEVQNFRKVDWRESP